MRKKMLLGALILTAAIFIFAQCGVPLEKKSQGDAYKQLDLFADVFSYVKKDYVEQTENKDLIYGALKGMLASLDPHSQFLDPEEYAELKVDTEGRFGGLGIEITLKDGLITVITPLEDTPAWKAGIKTGDKIVKIDNEVTRGFSLSEGVKKMRGKPGTKVTITVLREKESKLLDFTLTRDIIKIRDIKEARILQDGIAYIRLSEFREDTADELGKALAKLEKDGMQALIFDLRNNPGGLLTAAVETTEKFLEKGKLIVFTQGRDGRDKTDFVSHKSGALSGMPMAVLINEGSASGSEIFAGALQDHKQAIILGTKSFGKGSVQTLVPLSDGSAIKLTTSSYFTPSGRSIHKEGITPDIVVEFQEPVVQEEGAKKEKDIAAEEVFEKLEERQGDLAPEDNAYKKDNQIIAAMDVLKGLLIYRNNRHEK